MVDRVKSIKVTYTCPQCKRSRRKIYVPDIDGFIEFPSEVFCSCKSLCFIQPTVNDKDIEWEKA